MTEANQAATDAREASMSRVTTLDKVLQTATQEAASEPASKEEQPQDQKPTKKPINERITQLVDQRREQSERAEAAEARAKQLEEQLEGLRAKAAPIEEGDKPERSKFASDDDYIEALADWKATKAIAKREREQQEAQAKADFDKVEKNWAKSTEKAKADIPDYDDVISDADVAISDVLAITLKEHPQGAELLYYLAKHPSDARKASTMRPVQAVLYLDAIARGLNPSEADPPAPPRSKAPEPISPVRNSAQPGPKSAESFEEHRARRQAEKRR